MPQRRVQFALYSGGDYNAQGPIPERDPIAAKTVVVDQNVDRLTARYFREWIRDLDVVPGDTLTVREIKSTTHTTGETT